MSTQTTNFGLTQWTEDDNVLVSEINENFTTLDTLLKQFPIIKTGSFVGTGVYGSNNKNSVTFDSKPMFVMFYDIDLHGFMHVHSFGDTGRGYLRYANSSFGRNVYTWSGNTISWYCDDAGTAVSSSSSNASAGNQMNYSGRTYYYFYF